MTASQGYDERAELEARAAAGPVRRFLRRLESPAVTRILTVALSLVALAAGIGTYVALTSEDPLATRGPYSLVALIYLDLVLLLLIGAFIVRRVVRIWSERRRGAAGARMHVRLVAMFSALAVAPTIIVAGFSLLFFDLGLESWFSNRVRTAVQSSQAVAQAYLEEHRRNIEADALWIANMINREGPGLMAAPNVLNRLLDFQVVNRDLSEAVIFEENGRVLARSGLTIVLEFEPIPQSAIEEAKMGGVVILPTDAVDRVRALVRLDTIFETFLIVGQSVDPQVLRYVAETEGAVRQFEMLEAERSEIQISFALAFLMVALLLLLAAVWIGLNFATRLSAPVSILIAATERVRAGELTARVPVQDSGDEIDVLSRAFNRMTQQLRSQRDELLEANEQADRRRRFSETVLAGVSAGVIGLDRNGNIDLPNRRAGELLGIELDQLIGHDLRVVVPGMAGVLEEAAADPSRDFVERDIEVEGTGEARRLVVRAGAQTELGEVTGFVVTLDDMTALINAQRKAAWADVARRIAHEIRNPLTPIQLSAERLKRKYRKQISDDPETFDICTDTIIRQVSDIGRMVDEFSSFARMPAPSMSSVDLSDLCRQQVFLQRNANTHIDYELSLPEEPLIIVCDGRQVAQVIINVLKNAKEAIEGQDRANAPPGRIRVVLERQGDGAVVSVQDNGPGLPQHGRDRLTEPYVTNRDKGTGLGLAIVKKIMEDHDGLLELLDGPEGGALVRLTFSGADAAARPDARTA